jgi:hypothetical protein
VEDPSVQPPVVPEAPAAGYAPKAFEFSWSATPSANYYRLGADPDGASRFAVVADKLGGTAYALRDLALAQPPTRHRYALQACNAGGCSPWSAPVEPDPIRAIGYFKSSSPGAQAHGSDLVLSPDGGSLAVASNSEVSLYSRSAAGQWTLVQTLGISGMRPGPVLSMADDGTLVVGRPDAENNGLYQGAVDIYTRSSGSGWALTRTLDPPMPRDGATFGISVSISGDASVIAVSEYGLGASATSGAGAVWVYRRLGANWWVMSAQVDSPGPVTDIMFGANLKLSADGSTLVVTAPNESSSSTSDPNDTNAFAAGAAFVYAFSGLNWPQVGYLKAAQPMGGDQFGSSVSISATGDVIVVGSTLVPGSAAPMAGAAHVFRRSGGAYGYAQTIRTPRLAPWSYFAVRGNALTPDGTVLALGAFGDSSTGQGVNGDATQGSATLAGAAYLYRLSGGGFVQTAYLKAGNPDAGDRFGQGITISADGKTVAVGAPAEAGAGTGIGADSADNSAPNRGAAYLY